MHAPVIRQQVGRDFDVIGAWLATHVSPDPPAEVLRAVESATEWDAVADICERMGAYRAMRLVPRWRELVTSGTSHPLPKLTIQGEKVSLGSLTLGEVHYLYREAMPQETQVRIAYETFIARFLRYIERRAQVLTFEMSGSVVAVFVPEGEKELNIPALWKSFVDYAFSADVMRETLVLLLNTAKLAERGFSVPVVPIVRRGQAEALAAFVYATLREIQSRLKRYQSVIEKGEKDDKHIAQLQSRLEKQQGNYSEAFSAMDALEKREPERMLKIRELASTYTFNATTQLKSTRAIVAKFVPYIESLLSTAPEDYLELPLLLVTASQQPEPHLPGDAADQLCYACGRVLPKPKRGEKPKVYKANKFILQAPSQTLQGYFAQTEPTICSICAALAVACPIKMADDALLVSMRERGIGRDKAPGGFEYTNAHRLYEQHLRMFTTGELRVTAGRYLLLAANESGPNRKPLKAQMGGYEYALFKVASLLPADVLERFEAEVFLGANPRILPQRHVVVLRYLSDVFDVQPWALREDKATYAAISDAVRYVERDACNHAIYRLFEKSNRKAHFSEVELAQLEQGREAFARGLQCMAEMDGDNTKERRFREVAGLTGVLYAMVDLCGFEMHKRGIQDEDRRRELKKLIENVGNPNHFTYEAASHLNGQFAWLTRTQRTWFAFDEARNLLGEVGVTLSERDSTDENGRRKLQTCFDDVDAIYAYLFAKRYISERDQRDFTYELKLSLYSRFPELVR